MIVIKNKADTKITYPLESIADKDKVLFFDIETTGFSRKYCNVYLIGCMYFIGDEPRYAQWLAENFNDEANVLMAFYAFMQKFNTIIHFNGSSFDIPFLKERGEKYHLDFDFDSYKSIDIYKPISKLNHILKMDNQRQKTFEELLHIKRTDPFSGGDLTEVFKQYVESKDDRLLFPLLLHNKEDVINMGQLTSLLAVSDLFAGKYNISSYEIKDCKTLSGDIEEELCVTLNLDNTVPVTISYNYDGFYLKAVDDNAHLTIKIKNGTYKYFFENHKNYYYLPLEDKAIHKSVSSFVDKEYRKQATAATCYEKFSGAYLPIFTDGKEIFKQIFKETHKDKHGFIKADSINDDNIFEYTKMILEHLSERPKYPH